ncbi:MAG: 50S ribosomal protein L21 [Patescibacteria group bacterium]
MFAVIKTGGKQYVVKEGDLLTVEKLDSEVGKTVNFEVLLISDEEGKDVKVGSPVLSAKASGLIESHGAAKKVDVVKYKAKSKYRRRVGHRQPQTKVKITKLA